MLKSIQRYYRKISNDTPAMGNKIAGAQKTEMSISADGDFGEMKKTETRPYVQKPESWQVCMNAGAKCWPSFKPTCELFLQTTYKRSLDAHR